MLTHDSVLLKYSFNFAAVIDDPRLLHIVRDTLVLPATFIVAFEHLRYWEWSAMGVTFAVRRLLYRLGDSTVFSGVSCSRRDLSWRDRLFDVLVTVQSYRGCVFPDGESSCHTHFVLRSSAVNTTCLKRSSLGSFSHFACAYG